MRLHLILLFIILASSQITARTYGQHVSLALKDAPLEKVLDQIQAQSGYIFWYNKKLLKTAAPISLQLKDTPLAEALDILFRDLPLSYNIRDRTIVIKEKKTVVRKVPLLQDTIRGTVTDSVGQPLAGVSVRIVGTNRGTNTNAQGRFQFNEIPEGARLSFHLLGYVNQETAATPNISVQLQAALGQLGEVMVSTGYQTIPRERATGSFDVVDNELLNRSVSTDFLTRLENISPGLLFNRGDAEGTDAFLIRGRSTITADAEPLIVLDDFPYDGNLDNINPNDIENVSVLKDAAAASIWGARAANGVIVITTKKGRTARTRIEVNSNTTFQGKPDLYNVSIMSSEDRVEWERHLFLNNRYSDAQAATTLTGRLNPIPEAVELMIANPTDLDQRLNELKNHDVREDIGRYFYRNSTNQQHSVGISGSGESITYAFYGGYDRNIGNLVGASYDRLSLRSNTNYKITKRFNLDLSILYTQSNNKEGRNDGLNTSFGTGTISPYARLADENGNSLPYYGYHRKSFLDNVADGNLLDWEFRPIDEIHRQENTTKIRDYLINSGLRYTLMNGLILELKYQYQNQLSTASNVNHEGSYHARNMINMFAQYDPASGNINYPIPLGGTIQLYNDEIQGHQGRLQANYQVRWTDQHELDAIAGYEIRNRVTIGNNSFNYGYREHYSTVNTNLDFVNPYPVNTQTFSMLIPQGDNGISRLTDNFLSYYANAAYTYGGRYTASASFRKDEANLFGVQSNMKGTPLWSVGAGWQLDREDFYTVDWLNKARLRATYGVNGNISRAASAATRALFLSGGQTHNYTTAIIQQPPNENLRWEQVKMVNLGLDFALKGNILSGSIEYYVKDAIDLLAQAPTDPTLGFVSVFANVASMRGKGWDVQLNSLNVNRTIKWQTNLIYSHSTNKVTEYLMPVSTTGRTYTLNLNGITPVIGNPIYSAYSFSWAGLDPEIGAPMVYLNGEVSTDYNAIWNTTALDGMRYHGSVQPVHFGALRNTFTFGNFGLSFNISYKFGYFFRTATVLNGGLSSGFSGHGDYALRWQQPGNEQSTYVPAMIYPAVANRDNVYQYSSVHIHRADNIRLEDLNISYTLQSPSLPFQSLRLFLYCTNLGTLWTANDRGIDPYYNNIPLVAKSVAIGVNLAF